MSDTEYVLGYSRREQRRLVRQADTFAAEASWLLERAGVRSGWRAAEIGCGPLGIMDLLSRRIGVSGEAIGIDNDPGTIAMAREVVSELGLRNVSFVVGDATDTGLEPSSFDFAHARLLLIHSVHPERVIAEMSALVRTGGVVAVEEVDWVSWVCQPPHPAWDRLRDAIREFTRRQGLDMHIGRRLPELLRAAGLGEVSFRAVCPTYFTGEDDAYTSLVIFAKQLAGPLVAGGLLSADELAGRVNELENHLAKPGTLTIHPLFCQAWARKPTDGQEQQ